MKHYTLVLSLNWVGVRLCVAMLSFVLGVLVELEKCACKQLVLVFLFLCLHFVFHAFLPKGVVNILMCNKVQIV